MHDIILSFCVGEADGAAAETLAGAQVFVPLMKVFGAVTGRLCVISQMCWKQIDQIFHSILEDFLKQSIRL